MRIGALVLAIVSLSAPLTAQNRTVAPAPPNAEAPAPALFKEPAPFTKAIEFGGRFLGEKSEADRNEEERKNGFFPELSNMVTGGGWISAGPGYRHWLFGDRAIVEAPDHPHVERVQGRRIIASAEVPVADVIGDDPPHRNRGPATDILERVGARWWAGDDDTALGLPPGLRDSGSGGGEQEGKSDERMLEHTGAPT